MILTENEQDINPGAKHDCSELTPEGEFGMIQFLVFAIVVIRITFYALFLLVQEHVEWLAMVLLFVDVVLCLISRSASLFTRWYFCTRAVVALILCFLVVLRYCVVKSFWTYGTLQLFAIIYIVPPSRRSGWICLMVLGCAFAS